MESLHKVVNTQATGLIELQRKGENINLETFTDWSGGGIGLGEREISSHPICSPDIMN